MVGVGRDLCGSSSPTLLPKHPHPEEWGSWQECHWFLNLHGKLLETSASAEKRKVASWKNTFYMLLLKCIHIHIHID